jgi:hypothetical protein
VVVALSASVLLFAAPAGAAKAASSQKCPDPSGTVKVGVSFLGSTAASVSAKVGSVDTSSNPSDQATAKSIQAGADALNAAGGVAGCQVQPVVFNFSVISPDFNAVSQQECATFTQDNKVVAVLAQGYETALAADCFAKAKIPSFWVDSVVIYKPSCATSPRDNFYGVASVFACRYASFIKLWNNAGLFPPKAKVGILQYESVDGTKQNEALVKDQWGPQLKKLGMTYETFSISRPPTSSGYGDVGTQMNAAILKFKADGVNAVLFTPPGATMVTTFLPAALAQGYSPSLGLTTNETPGSTVAVAPAAISKAVVISWQPADQPVSAQQALPANPAIPSCAAWSPVNRGASGAQTGASNVCDFYNAVAAGFKNATKLDAATFRKGVVALGTSFDSTMTYGGATKFSNNVLDGGIKAQVLTWDASTKSFVPTSKKQITIP